MVSQKNVEIVRRGFEHIRATGEPLTDILAPEFVWDMTTFRDGTFVSSEYQGANGMLDFLREWTEPFEEWEIEVDELLDAGDKVVALCRQHARSKTSGVPVDMRLGMVFTLRDGLQTRMEMYADAAEALSAAGLAD
jgi:ketosteroid isomerase-like protein